jgi:hypothetical protein
MHNNTLPSQFCAVEEDGFYEYSINRRYIGPDTKLLEGLSKNVAQIIHGLMPDTVMAASSAHLALARELRQVNLHTVFRPMTDTENRVSLVPTFQPPGAEMNMEWRPPEGLRLFFIGVWANNRDMISAIPTCYLVARDSDRRTYLLPLPNLYEDGKICLGNFDSTTEMLRPTVFETFNRAIEIFDQSKWNTDLLEERRIVNSKRLFRFTPEGESLPPEGAWPPLCWRTNNTVYQFVGELP